MTLHLLYGQGTWCDADRPFDVTDDPRDATCSDCLKRAASYGAAAAMRYAAVEAGATQDPELVRERDEAIRRINTIAKLLEKQGAFFCNDCMTLHRLADIGLIAGSATWCKACAPGVT